MSNIEQNLAFILSSQYGKDVRQTIHDAIHDCYEDGKAGAIDLVAREQIANLVANAGSTEKDSELVDARIGFDSTVYASVGEAIRTQIKNLYYMEDVLKQTYGKDGITYPSHLAANTYLLYDFPIQKTGIIKKAIVYVNGEGTIDIAIVHSNNGLLQYRGVTFEYEVKDIPVTSGENVITLDIPVEKGDYFFAVRTGDSVSLSYFSNEEGNTPAWSVQITESQTYVIQGATAKRFYGISWYISSDNYAKQYIDSQIDDVQNSIGIFSGNQWNGKTCVTYGDSITYGNTWQPTLKELMGFTEMWNRGASNSTMSNIGTGKMAIYNDISRYSEEASSWLYQSPYNGNGDDLPEGVSIQNYWMYDDDRINKIPSGKDLCIIMCPTNDFFNSISNTNVTDNIIGETTFTAYWNNQDNIYDNSTVIGALCTCIQKMMKNYPNMRIVVVGMPFNNGLRNKEIGQYFFEMLDGVKDAARSMGVPYIDLVSKLQWNNNNLLSKCSDGVHPTNTEVGKEIAYAISYELKNIPLL